MTPQELGSIDSLIQEPNEVRSVEYKASGSLDDYRHKLARAALGLANLRDGGYIVIGVDEIDGALQSRGMSQEDYDSYIPDHVLDKISPYLSRPVSIECLKRELEGALYVVIRVGQFQGTPVFAKKGHGNPKDSDQIVEGIIYCRPLGGKPQTRRVTPDDLDEILNIALEQRLGEYVGRAERSGLSLVPRAGSPQDLQAQLDAMQASIDALIARGSPDPGEPPARPYENELENF